MLNSEKNSFLNTIRATGVELGMFRLETVVSKPFNLGNKFQPEGLKVHLVSSELWFVVFKCKEGSMPMFACKATHYDYVKEDYVVEGWRQNVGETYVSDEKGRTVYIRPLSGASNALKEWINNNIPEFIEEKSIPDLWQMAASAGAITSLAGADDTHFSVSEKEQLRQAIDQLGEFIKVTFEANEQQIKLIEQKLDVLKVVVDSFGRMSWFTLALGTLVTIGNTLYLNNEQGRILTQFARHVFEGAVKYLQ